VQDNTLALAGRDEALVSAANLMRLSGAVEGVSARYNETRTPDTAGSEAQIVQSKARAS
jgi:hypothetical protein